jgi:predicted nucleic acid-binding protein
LTLFVDTSVWSLALRRDAPPDIPQISALSHALAGSEQVVATGLVLQELLQGFGGARAREQIVSRFAALPFVISERDDHVAAADLRTSCRRHGIQVGTIDALFAQLCIRHDFTMLTTDADFGQIASRHALRIWPS